MQTATFRADCAQPAGSAGRHGAVSRAVPADDRQRVPVGPDAQRAAERPRDRGANEAHTQPQTAQVDVPAADRGDARVHGQGADQAEPGDRRRVVVRHQAAVVVVQGRGRLRRQQQPVVRVRLAQAVRLLFGQEGQKKRRRRQKQGQEKMYRQLFLQLSHLLFGRVFRLNARKVPLNSPLLIQIHTHTTYAYT